MIPFTLILVKAGDFAVSNALSAADRQFVSAFERCELGAESFHHRDHIRLAWAYLESLHEKEACARMAESIRRFAAHHGATEKYHHTTTIAWMRLVAGARRADRGGRDFEKFLSANERLLDREALQAYYSRSLLNSPEARSGWVEPDLAPLPD